MTTSFCVVSFYARVNWRHRSDLRKLSSDHRWLQPVPVRCAVNIASTTRRWRATGYGRRRRQSCDAAADRTASWTWRLDGHRGIARAAATPEYTELARWCRRRTSTAWRRSRRPSWRPSTESTARGSRPRHVRQHHVERQTKISRQRQQLLATTWSIPEFAHSERPQATRTSSQSSLPLFRCLSVPCTDDRTSS